MDVTKYGVIYGGVQKNIGPAGVVIVIIREDLITDDVLPGTPTMLKYKTHADNDSLYNTPPAYGIYICGKVFKWLKKQGGLEKMKEYNEEKAKILYDFLDESRLFHGTVRKEDRSASETGPMGGTCSCRGCSREVPVWLPRAATMPATAGEGPTPHLAPLRKYENLKKNILLAIFYILMEKKFSILLNLRGRI